MKIALESIFLWRCAAGRCKTEHAAIKRNWLAHYRARAAIARSNYRRAARAGVGEYIPHAAMHVARTRKPSPGCLIAHGAADLERTPHDHTVQGYNFTSVTTIR